MPEEKVPNWFKRESFDVATIDFNDRVPGVTMTIGDPTAKETSEMIATFRKNAALPNGGSETEIAAAWLKAYAVEIKGEQRIKVFNTDLPAKGAQLDVWTTWASSIKHKHLTRLITGIGIFHKEAAEVGND